jgi:hypothetical protein
LPRKPVPRRSAGTGADVYPAAIYHRLTFRELEARLLERLSQKLLRGEISERRLARLTGYTQPHIHNVLKGVRRFHTDLADAVMRSLQISIDELVDAEALSRAQEAVPLWREVVGPRHRFPEGGQIAGHRVFPVSFLARFADPVLVWLAAEEDGMTPLIAPGDLVLVDRSEAERRRPVFEGVYVLAFSGEGAVCRCQAVGSALVLLTENTRRSYRLPGHLSLVKRSVLDFVRGRVVWTSRELS